MYACDIASVELPIPSTNHGSKGYMIMTQGLFH